MQLRVTYKDVTEVVEVGKEETTDGLLQKAAAQFDVEASTLTLCRWFPRGEPLSEETKPVQEVLSDKERVLLADKTARVKSHSLNIKVQTVHTGVSLDLSVASHATWKEFMLLVASKLKENVDKLYAIAAFPRRRIDVGGNTPVGQVLEDREKIMIHCQDAASAQAPTPEPKKRKSDGRIMSVEETLMGSVTKGGNKTAAMKGLQSAFKNAMERRKKSSLAEMRWAAVEGGHYEMKVRETARRRGRRGRQVVEADKIESNTPCEAWTPRGGVGLGNIEVSFPGEQGQRKWQTETVALLPFELLRAVVCEVMKDEDAVNNLRPVYLAEANPGVFWSIVKYFKGDLMEALKEFLPHRDLGFLEHRERPMSEKAMEYARQRSAAQARRAKRTQSAPSGSKKKKKRKKTATSSDEDSILSFSGD
eukprot:Platyproteum_vivax@DN5194_c0_g1_i2.p1